MKRLGIFVDLGNILYCCGRKFGDEAKVDYKLYLTEAQKISKNIIRAVAYGAQVNNEAEGFIACLRSFGYDTKYRSNKENGKRYVDWSLGIAMDIVRMIEKLDIVIIGSSNCEFAPVIDWIKEKGVRVTVFACGIPRELKEKSDRYIEINEKMLEGKQ